MAVNDGVGVVPGTDGNASNIELSNSGDGSEPAEEREVQDEGRVGSLEPGRSSDWEDTGVD